jgi:hypothetical protein
MWQNPGVSNKPKQMKPLADIPNWHGFQLVGICKDGTETPAFVRRGSDGRHRVCDAKTGEMIFSKLAGWRKPTKADA